MTPIVLALALALALAAQAPRPPAPPVARNQAQLKAQRARDLDKAVIRKQDLKTSASARRMAQAKAKEEYIVKMTPIWLEQEKEMARQQQAQAMLEMQAYKMHLQEQNALSQRAIANNTARMAAEEAEHNRIARQQLRDYEYAQQRAAYP